MTLRGFWKLLAWSFLALVLLSLAGLEGFLVLPLTVLFGWIGFIRGVVPSLIWNWDLVVTGAVCLAVFIGGFHATAGWLRRASVPTAAGWPWRWTMAVTAGVVLMFTAAIAVIGVLHQVTWLARTDERALKYDFARHPEQIIWQARSVIDAETAKRRDEHYQPTGTLIRAALPTLLERMRSPDIRIIVLSEPEDRLVGLVVDFRDAKQSAHYGVRIHRWDQATRKFYRLKVEPQQYPEFIADAEAGRSLERFPKE